MERESSAHSPLRLQPEAATPSGGESGRRAGLLFQLVQGLGLEPELEPSFKITRGRLLPNRFLLGLRKNQLGPEPDRRLEDAFRRMGVPEPLLVGILDRLPESNYVHLGFEEGERSVLYKVYLEFWSSIEAQIQRGNDVGPFLLHLGYKWDVAEPRKTAVTRYEWHPWIPVEEIASRAGAILGAGAARGRRALHEVLEVASARVPARDILYLEVTEDGNARRSFDVNVYRAGLRVAELYPQMGELCQEQAVSFPDFQRLYAGIRNRRFGHVSGGLDREAKPFFSIYYGVQGFPGRASPADGSSGPLPPSIAPSAFTPPETTAPAEERDREARLLFRLIQGLGVGIVLERSFKVLRNTLLSDRFLLGFQTDALDGDRPARVLEICRELRMPGAFLEEFGAELSRASILLFGFERGERTCVYKVFLERGGKIARAGDAELAPPEPFLGHIELRWNPEDATSNAVSDYTWFPGMGFGRMIDRIAGTFRGDRSERAPYRIVEGVLGLAANRTGPGGLRYLEAREGHDPQLSFDVNAYRANLRMAELYPLWLEAARHYSVPLDRFHSVYEPAKDLLFGHLAGGTDRDGRGFLTVCYSDEGRSRRAGARGPHQRGLR